MFYNNVYLPELTVKYIMKFSPNISESPPLSPLPRLNANPMSPYRRVSQRFPLYISPLKTANFPPSPLAGYRMAKLCENSPTKRQCTDTMNRKIRDIVSERQSIESNGALNNSNGSAADNSND
ncbi:unnamed protein product, partial [Oppiella nova]